MALKLESVDLSARDDTGQQFTLGLQINGLALHLAAKMNLKALPPKLRRSLAIDRCRPAVVGAGFSRGGAVGQRTDFTPFQIIGQRNIFDPNRVPHVRSGYSRSAPRIVDSFSFVGTMSYAKGTFAFFDGTSPDFPQGAGAGRQHC